MNVKEGHTSNRGHWLSLSSWKCNICHDPCKMTFQPQQLPLSERPFCPVRAACTGERCTLALCASLPIHSRHESHRCTHLFLPRGFFFCFSLVTHWQPLNCEHVQFLSQHLQHMLLTLEVQLQFLLLSESIMYQSEKAVCTAWFVNHICWEECLW